jgi:hypothetical protein
MQGNTEDQMKKTVATLVAATLLSLGAAFAQESKPAEAKPAAPATSTEKSTSSTEKTTTTPKKTTKKSHKKSTTKAANGAETKTETKTSTTTEAPKK